MSKPKSDVCSQGHRDMVEGKNGRRWCRTCNRDRQRRFQAKKTLDAMEEERKSALERMRVIEEGSSEYQTLARFLQRTEDRMDRIDSGAPLPRQHRKWVARVNRHDGLLCEACEARVFPDPKRAPLVEKAPVRND